jgi:broad specificity phosphatase PhoE
MHDNNSQTLLYLQLIAHQQYFPFLTDRKKVPGKMFRFPLSVLLLALPMSTPFMVPHQLLTKSTGVALHQSSMVEDDVVAEARNMETRIVTEMPGPLPETKNRYYFLRHGQSTANLASIISSDRSLAYSDKHGLTPFGYKQGKESAQQLLDQLEAEGVKSGEKVVFVSSPFARAHQTAQACLDGLADDDNRKRAESMGVEIATDIVMEHRLMERYFGRLDGEAIYTYAYVWPVDKMDVTHTAFEVESVAAVCTRLAEVVERCESDFEEGRHHIVSHADVLQIGQLYAANADNVGEFSSYRFKNGEVRAMKRSQADLPEPVPLEAPKRGTTV